MMPQPRVNMHRKAVVACVNGKQYEIYLQMKKEEENQIIRINWNLKLN